MAGAAQGAGRWWVAFIRAINGSPHNRVRMVDLAGMMRDAGCSEVSWHLQTGNMFFHADGDRDELAVRIQARLEGTGMRRADVMLRTPAELAALTAVRPFRGMDSATWQFEATFLGRAPAAADTTELTERHGAVIAHQDPTVVCFAFPRGGRMDGGFNGWIEKRWNVPATSRAWNVVEAVAAKASAL